MNEWLSRRADALADVTGLDREALELAPQEIQSLLDVAAFAAHEGGARTNAPLVCYLLGVSRSSRKSIDELAEIVRSTS